MIAFCTTEPAGPLPTTPMEPVRQPRYGSLSSAQRYIRPWWVEQMDIRRDAYQPGYITVQAVVPIFSMEFV
jgi:hypothetical protein